METLNKITSAFCIIIIALKRNTENSSQIAARKIKTFKKT